MNTQIQIIENEGEPEYAVVPIELYRSLVSLAEDAEDIRAADQAMRELESGEDETIPAEVAARLFAEEHPLKVWREHRGMTQDALAEQAGVGKSYISQIESGKKTGSVSVLSKIAAILKLDVNDVLVLVPNAETMAAMQEARRGNLETSDSVDSLMRDLDDEVD